MRQKIRSKTARRQAGQALTEYGAIIAFVSALAALVLSVFPNPLAASIVKGMTNVTGQINSINTAVSGSS